MIDAFVRKVVVYEDYLEWHLTMEDDIIKSRIIGTSKSSTCLVESECKVPTMDNRSAGGIDSKIKSSRSGKPTY